MDLFEEYLKKENIMNKCIGCGILLQDTDKMMDGYVSSANHSLCERCFRIKKNGC